MDKDRKRKTRREVLVKKITVFQKKKKYSYITEVPNEEKRRKGKTTESFLRHRLRLVAAVI